MQSLNLQNPDYMWSNYVKLEIPFKSIAQYFSIINTEILLNL